MKIHEFLDAVGTPAGWGKVTVDLVAQGHRLSDQVVVSQTQFNLFMAALHAAVEAGLADRSLYDHFAEAFPTANAGQFIG